MGPPKVLTNSKDRCRQSRSAPYFFQEQDACPSAHTRFRLKSISITYCVLGDILSCYLLPGNNLFIFIRFAEADLLKQNGVNPSGKQKHVIILIHHLFSMRILIVIKSGGRVHTLPVCQTLLQTVDTDYPL